LGGYSFPLRDKVIAEIDSKLILLSLEDRHPLISAGQFIQDATDEQTTSLPGDWKQAAAHRFQKETLINLANG
jgi:hypothetical protein